MLLLLLLLSLVRGYLLRPKSKFRDQTARSFAKPSSRFHSALLLLCCALLRIV
jgi:hypothetical protein